MSLHGYFVSSFTVEIVLLCKRRGLKAITSNIGENCGNLIALNTNVLLS